MFGSMGQTNVKNLGNGGTMDGDVTISGDLTVSGGISLSLNEVLQGTSTIDINNTKALLVRKDGDGGDIFIVDTSTPLIKMGGNLTFTHDVATISSTTGLLQFRILESGQDMLFDAGGDFKFRDTDDSNATRLTIESGTGNATFTGTATISGGILTLGTADTSSGHINAFENMSFNIDTDNDDTGRFFEFAINGSSGSGTELMRLTEDGDLGLGTTATANRPISVKVNRSGTQELKFENDDSGEWYFTLQNDRITEDSVSHAINFDANDSGGSNTRYSKIENVIVDNSSGSEDGKLVFSTFVNGTSTETMHITNSSVGIGASPTKALTVKSSGSDDGIVLLENTGTILATIFQSGDSSGYPFLDLHDGAGDTKPDNVKVRLNSGGASFLNGGNVGIGTASPTDAGLHINGSGNSGRLKIQQTSASDYSLIAHVTPSRQWNVGVGGASSASSLQNNYFIQDVTGGVTPLILDNSGNATFSGNVGIGGTSSSQIHITQSGTTTADGIRLTNAESFELMAGIIGSTSSGFSIFDVTDNAVRLSIDTSGNVNIPQKLEIGGNLGVGVAPSSSYVLYGSSSSSPTIRLTDTTNTTILDLRADDTGALVRSTGNHPLRLNTNQVDRLTISNSGTATFSGNVEIISSNGSNTKLLIENNHASANALLQIDSSNDRDSVIQLLENGTAKWDIRNDGNDSDKLKISDDGDVRLTIDQSGNVNIDTGNLAIGNSKGNSITTDTEVTIYGGEGGDSILQLLADNADNTADYFAMRQLASGNFTMGHHTGGGFNDALVIGPYASGNNVGIGGTPTRKLSVFGSAYTEAGGADANIFLSVANSSWSGMALLGGTSQGGFIDFGDTDAVHRGRILYSHANDNMQFNTSAVTRFILDDNSRISLSNNDGGADNTVFGKLAGNALTTNGDENVLLGHEAGNDMDTGERNVIIGYQSGDKLTSGNRSVAIGYGSLGSEQTGARSIAVGFNALSQQNVGANTYNTAVGVEAGFYNRTGTANTFLGYNSGKGASEQSNSSNVGVGYHSLLNVTTGSNNTAVGKDAMLNVTTGSYNVAIGNIAMDSATTGGTNVAIGSRALATSQAPLYNVAVGADALFGIPAGEAITGAVAIGTEAFKGDSNSTTGANYTVAIGQEALKYLQTGGDNVAIGYQSQDANTTGSQNVSLGRGSLSGTVDGVSNTAIGAYAMSIGDVGTSNTAVGSQSMTDSTGSYNTALGMQSLFDCVAGGSNTVVGALAMKFANGGETSNVAIGVEAMRDVKENGNTADSNIAIGVLSMKGGTLGGDFIGNIAIGDRAMDSTDTNAQTGTIAIGHHSLTALTSGAGNTAVGYQCLDATDDGALNTAVGYQSLSANCGNGNVAVGYRAGYGVTGALNILIGHQAGHDTVQLTSGTQNIVIGDNARTSASNSTNQVVIGRDAQGVADNSVTLGNSSVTAVYMAQDSGATMYAGGLSVDNGTGTVNRGNSSGDIFEARGLNTSQMKITTSAFTVTPNATFTGSVSGARPQWADASKKYYKIIGSKSLTANTATDFIVSGHSHNYTIQVWCDSTNKGIVSTKILQAIYGSASQTDLHETQYGAGTDDITFTYVNSGGTQSYMYTVTASSVNCTMYYIIEGFGSQTLTEL